ncbi:MULTISPECIES: L-threonylcarbamoyladenylate synthase [Idiomarinaceae]|uniref:Threonylcarbamoyl-AMP synthase n=4 Tax=Pseudidiomarina TaxID=2800384 RepID=A0A368V288_9GAMM|nr:MULTISPECIES: Sua5/YciO/YrdC/YwlC family protein [Idiomarinaceae]MDT7525691.1 Sua5/YciO/YrdC/YwlC family protein [Pseudidiomarina sp. GXY010]MDX1526026.1 Sua5/YciO/YrdC/YwlC family protein [Pseudidiomarina maritima]MRJ42158.1 L-threonylcarbamoyladenylate synthase type 1 TsaC [Idiomarina sp. FeN1]NCU57084.1 L-threonylcarbamoyladenylate synthase type 1 TsaC [Idiomarina sp. FenA--70]NCU59793.1 L-threonylcarbamoyladenylate synthase type 1 TsaC [Idiomarina sp. FenBw--71]
MLDSEQWLAAKQAFQAGQVLAYPTEAVFGLGCDPRNESAVRAVLALKQRPESKGLILLAADYSQLVPYVDDLAIPQDKRFAVFSNWPGAVTLLLPAAANVPEWLRGDHNQIAVRVTAHEPARQLCKALGSAIVSTSANRSGQPALTTAAQVTAEFGEGVAWVMPADVGGASKPSRIIDPLTQQVIRD